MKYVIWGQYYAYEPNWVQLNLIGKMDGRWLGADLCSCIGFTLSHMFSLTQHFPVKAYSSAVSVHSGFELT